ncbi:MAG: zinc ribbon domain-containing protein [Deltaproteobacteria bacterium]|jgi:putative FmdB family regulatory protein|nr:zinc ribbon domain-containing protein [Deltaproteobacteria bacterium]
MPIYEYECENCHDVFEINQKVSDPSPHECPACGKGPLHKIMSRSSFRLKGSGWYSSDYKAKDGSDSALGKAAAAAVDPDKPPRKSYLHQTPDERKSTIKEITNSVANRI